MKRLKTFGRRTLMLLGGLMLVLIAIGVIRKVTHAGPSDEARVERNIEIAFTSDDPDYCDALTTQRYLEQTTGERSPFADEICEYRAGDGRTESVAIDGVRIDGDRASARVSPTGGSLDGSTIRVGLVHEDDYWRLDRIIAIERFDRAAFRREYRRSFLTFGSPPSSASCGVGRERRLSDAEIEADLLGRTDSLFGPIAVECDRSGVERSTVAAIASPDYGYPAAGIACVERRQRAASDDELVAIALQTEEYGALVLACDRRAPFDSLERVLRADDDVDRAAADCVLSAFRGHSRQQALRLGYDDDRYEAIVDRCQDL